MGGDVVDPYAVPEGPVASELDANVGVFEGIRRKHLNTEVTIKQLGLLFMIGGAITAISRLAVIVAERASTNSLLGLSLSGLAIYGGSQLRLLMPRGQAIQTVWVALSIGALFPIDPRPTLVGTPDLLVWDFFVLWALWSAKGRVVFSEHYRDVVIPATPQVMYRVSVVVWICGVMIVLFILLGIVAVMMSRHPH